MPVLVLCRWTCRQFPLSIVRNITYIPKVYPHHCSPQGTMAGNGNDFMPLLYSKYINSSAHPPFTSCLCEEYSGRQFSISRQTYALNTPLATQSQTSHKPPTRKEEYIRIQSSDKALLNDTCMNNCTALLYSIYLPLISRRITILSTYELSCIRHNATDIELCWNTKGTSLWEISISPDSSANGKALGHVYFQCRYTDTAPFQ